MLKLPIQAEKLVRYSLLRIHHDFKSQREDLEILRRWRVAFLHDREKNLFADQILDERPTERFWLHPGKGPDWQDRMEHVHFPNKGGNVPPACESERKTQ